MPKGKVSELWMTKAQVRAAVSRFTEDSTMRANLYARLRGCYWESGQAAAFAEYFTQVRCFDFARYLRALG